MSEALDPQEVDRLAAQAEFFRNVKQYAREDALGTAPRHIQVRLRDKHNLKAWMVAIHALLNEVTNKPLLQALNLRKLECADLRISEGRIERMMKARAQQERGIEAVNYFKDTLATYGWEFPEGISTKEITCILLAAIEHNTRKP